MTHATPHTLSHNDKPNRTTAFDLVLKLNDPSAQLEQHKIDSLLMFFAPNIPAKPKTPFQWVAQACGKKDVRYYLNYIYVSPDNRIIGSDGRRVHIIQNDDDRAPGFYDPKTHLKVTLDAKYPQFDKVFKGDKEPTTLISNELSSNNIYVSKFKDQYFQTSYINQANPFDDELYLIDNQRITLINKFGTALVMPIRL